jgi:hypothetical protein
MGCFSLADGWGLFKEDLVLKIDKVLFVMAHDPSPRHYIFAVIPGSITVRTTGWERLADVDIGLLHFGFASIGERIILRLVPGNKYGLSTFEQRPR